MSETESLVGKNVRFLIESPDKAYWTDGIVKSISPDFIVIINSKTGYEEGLSITKIIKYEISSHEDKK